VVKVLWTSESKKWLGEIFDYIASDSPVNAKEVIYNIIERADVLRDFPSIGQRLLDWPDYEIRMILYGHYRVVYRIISEQRIDILGVYHNALDLKQHLKI